MSNPEKLLIIGNGADLACNLKSGYDDFLKTRLSQSEKINNVKELFSKDNFKIDFISKVIDIRISGDTNAKKDNDERNAIISFISLRMLDRISFWEIPDVMGNHSQNWNGVENSILKFLIAIHSNNENKFGNQGETINGLYKEINEIQNSIIKDDCVIFNSEFSICSLFFLKAIDFIYQEDKSKVDEYSVKKYLKEMDIDNALFDELKMFEDNFKNYIRCETRNDYYKKDLFNLIDKLVKDAKTNIISFNYTKHPNDPDNPNSENNNVNKFINIHGDVDRKIVFGIDSNWRINCDENLMEEPNKLDYFSKTYRLMNGKHFQNILSDGIKTIAFYGHSLSKADYAYFQSVFDKYDIYDSDVELVFYYSSRWKDRDERQKANEEHRLFKEDFESIKAKASTMKKVYRLMNDYGETLDNKDHGKNLLHKMILEDRLSVQRVEIDN